MKVITPASMAAINQRTGVTPVVVISILWGHDLKWYTSLRVEIPGITSEARISGLGEVTCEKRTDNRSTTGALRFELDDSDGALKYYVDNVRIEQARATAWLWLSGTDFNDRILLLDGKLSAPDWSDDERHLNVTLETIVEKEEIGFAPTKQDFPDLSDEAVGTAWPLAFGTVKNLPAVRVRQKTIGILTADVRLHLEFERFDDLEKKDKLKLRSYIPNGAAEAFEDSAIYVTNGEKFPQDTLLILSIDGVLFRGKFQGAKFIITETHYPRYQGIRLENISTLPQAELTKIAVATAGQDVTCAVLPESFKGSLSNMFCYCTPQRAGSSKKMFNYCVRQINNVAIFKYPFWSLSGTKVNANEITIDEVYAIAKNGLIREDVERLWYFRSRYGATVSNQEYELLNQTVTSPSSFWRRQAGTSVYIYDYLDPDVYIASSIRMASIDSVYAKKKVQVLGKERKIFTPIPTVYYKKQLTSNYEVNGEQVSGLIFHTPLAEYQNQEWEDTVYISGTSSLGPNPVDIIQHILENYTDLHLDGSFDAVKSKVDPVNFVVFDRRNALAFAQEIAWQSRCVLLIDSNVVGIKYLGEAPDAVMLFNESNIDAYSVRMSTTPIGDVITRFVGTWTDDYKDAPQPSSLNLSAVRDLARILKTLMPDTYREKTATKVYTYTENIDIYGLRTEETNVFVFNDEASVKKAIDFWGHRAANSWQRVHFRPLNLDALALQPYDGVAISLNIPPISLNVVGVVESVNYDQGSKSVNLDIWLPMKAGVQAVDSKAYG